MPGGIDGPYNVTVPTDFTLPALRDVVNVVWRVNVRSTFGRVTSDPLMDRLFQQGWWSLGLDLTFAGLFPVFTVPAYVEIDEGAAYVVSRVGSAYDTLRVGVWEGGDIDFWVIWA